MTEGPDFAALRAERDAAIREIVRAAHIELGGDPAEAPTFHSHEYGAACYCACPDGPCEHEFQGSRNLLDDQGNICGAEQVCARCGMGAMSHDLRCMD